MNFKYFLLINWHLTSLVEFKLKIKKIQGFRIRISCIDYFQETIFTIIKTYLYRFNLVKKNPNLKYFFKLGLRINKINKLIVNVILQTNLNAFKHILIINVKVMSLKFQFTLIHKVFLIHHSFLFKSKLIIEIADYKYLISSFYWKFSIALSNCFKQSLTNKVLILN